VTFVTAPFESAAQTHARIHGLPDLPLVVIPSDYVDGSDAVVAATVEPVLDQLLAALVRPTPS
jgi:hypothetical protein